MKLTNILKELLDPETSQAYEFDDPKPKIESHKSTDGTTENKYTWTYKNVKGQKMEIEINYESFGGESPDPSMLINFGPSIEATDRRSILSKYSAMTGAGDLKRILKTIIVAAEYVIAKELPDTGERGLYKVGYEPSDDKRDRIYRYFIETNFPDFKEDEEATGEDHAFKWFINQNYEPPQA